MFGKQYKNRSLIREALSEKGVGSAKRVFGAIILLICLGCIVYLVIKEGATEHVTELLNTCLIIAAALLGISSITNIWKSQLPAQQSSDCSSLYTPQPYGDDEEIGDASDVQQSECQMKHKCKFCMKSQEI